MQEFPQIKMLHFELCSSEAITPALIPSHLAFYLIESASPPYQIFLNGILKPIHPFPNTIRGSGRARWML